MTKIITLIVLAIVIYAIVKGYRRRSSARSDGDAPRQTEDMVRCSVCGIHLPRSEGLLAQGRYYCGPDHQRQHAGDG